MVCKWEPMRQQGVVSLLRRKSVFVTRSRFSCDERGRPASSNPMLPLLQLWFNLGCESASRDQWLLWRESLVHSYRSASIGSIFAAFSAGQNPENTPTMARIANEIPITNGEVRRKISPS